MRSVSVMFMFQTKAITCLLQFFTLRGCKERMGDQRMQRRTVWISVYVMWVPISGIMAKVCGASLLWFLFSNQLLGASCMMSFWLINGVITENIGKMRRRYFPFVFGLFVYILNLNAAGLFSYTVYSFLLPIFYFRGFLFQ